MTVQRIGSPAPSNRCKNAPANTVRALFRGVSRAPSGKQQLSEPLSNTFSRRPPHGAGGSGPRSGALSERRSVNYSARDRLHTPSVVCDPCRFQTMCLGNFGQHLAQNWAMSAESGPDLVIIWTTLAELGRVPPDVGKFWTAMFEHFVRDACGAARGHFSACLNNSQRMGLVGFTATQGATAATCSPTRPTTTPSVCFVTPTRHRHAIVRRVGTWSYSCTSGPEVQECRQQEAPVGAPAEQANTKRALTPAARVRKTEGGQERSTVTSATGGDERE